MDAENLHPSNSGEFSLPRAAGYLLGVLVIAVLGAYLGARVERFWAPWLLFPLLEGMVLAAASFTLADKLGFAHRPTIYVSLTVGSLLIAFGQLSYGYLFEPLAATSPQLDAVKQAFPEVAKSPSLSAPANVWEFLQRNAALGRQLPFGFVARGTWAWVSWGLDASLITAGAIGVARFGPQLPFCRQCKSYFRLTRREMLSEAQVWQLSRALGWSLDSANVAQYLHFTCKKQCGEDFARLFIKGKPGRGAQRREFWLNRADRARVFQILDQSE